MNLVLSLLTSKLAGPLASGVAVLALLFGVSQCSGRLKAEGKIDAAEQKAEKAEKARKVAQGNYDQCKANRITLDEARKRQNAAVEAVAKEGERRLAESAKAARSARAVAESLRRDADRILAAKAGPDACASADAIILGEVR